MLNLELKINSVSIQLGCQVGIFTNSLHVEPNSMAMDVFNQSTTSVRKLGWLAKHFAGGLKGESVHKVSSCLIQLLDEFQLAPLDAHSPFGPLKIAMEVFSMNDIVRKINIHAISPRIAKQGLPCRAEIILDRFNECCICSFGSPATLSFSANSKSVDDIFRVWEDEDSIVKSWCLDRKAFVAMWELKSRSGIHPRPEDG